MRRLPIIDERPLTRAECKHGQRCTIACEYRLDFEFTHDGGIYLRGDLRKLPRLYLPAHATPAEVEAFTDEAAQRMLDGRDTCALDVIDRNPDGCTLEQVGNALGCTRERIRQIEARAMQNGRVRRGIRKLLGGKR